MDIYLLKTIVLIIVILFLITSIDDLFFDFYYYLRGRKRTGGRLKISDLDQLAPKPIAIFIPAWQEQDVIAPMLINTFSSLNYPSSFYDIFVGVYPNDSDTKEAVERLLPRYKNLHLVVNEKEGPTNKANNLNSIYNALNEFEEKNGIKFSIISIHDSEDVIHPTSLKLINYLIPSHPSVQLPVFPLQPYPTFKTFLKYITTGTYADEFAENHLRGLAVREAAKAFVPSAGTGFSISRKSIDKLVEKSKDGQIFDEKSLTEDYEVSLRLQKIDEGTHYFIEGVKRVLGNGRVINEYIATREFFPNSFRLAIKQKSRWIYGIAFQTAGVKRSKGLKRAQRYSLFRDWKAKYANLLLMPGYLILTYIIVSYFMLLQPLFTYGTLSWWLTVVMTALAIERQILRAIALKNIYGWRSAIYSCFVPPLLPIRFIWGNIINFFATTRAWRVRLFGNPKTRAKWEKTPHTYLPPEILTRYQRKLGDLLLEKNIVTPTELKKLLVDNQETGGKKLGETLIEKGFITEDKLLPVLGELLKTGYIDIEHGLIDHSLTSLFPESLAKELSLLPILQWRGGILLASSKPLSTQDLRYISIKTGLAPKVVLASPNEINQGIKSLYSSTDKVKIDSRQRLGEVLVGKGLIDENKFIEAYKIKNYTGKKLGQVLLELNLINEQQLAEALVEISEG